VSGVEHDEPADDWFNSDDRFRLLADAAPVGIFVSAPDGRALYVNRQGEINTGRSWEEIRDLKWHEFIHPDDLAIVVDEQSRSIEAGDGFIAEYRIVRPDGDVVWVRSRGGRILDEAGQTIAVMGTVADITEVHEATERLRHSEQQMRDVLAELEHRATHDELTGLPNRVVLEAQLEVALARSRTRRGGVAVLMILIDRVSLVAEALGHQLADQLLIEAADRIHAVAVGTIPARFAHDQFVVVLEDLDDVNAAVCVAQTIIDSIGQPFLLDSGEAVACAFVGIAMSPDGQRRPQDLIADSGVAMRRARELNLSGFEIFDPQMRARVDAQRRSEIALRHGIERDEFELYYQPIVDLRSGVVVSAEALIRWHRPGTGMVLPDAFIPIAEESGLVIDVGSWVIQDACAQVAKWQRDLGPSCPNVSINLSGRQLAHPELTATVRDAIQRTGADPSLLTFEITETVLLRDVERAVATLESLRDLGVRLSLDDFGTGYSSLTYLTQFPIDTLKIDRSFVSRGVDVNEPIVNMILVLAATLGLDVVAEGVETDQQADSLRAAGCTKAQGFLFARPAPSDDLVQMLRPSGTLEP
jgi:PAS domain S-box-containing protein/diguanylate cyclase (GGDEF)-like protein